MKGSLDFECGAPHFGEIYVAILLIKRSQVSRKSNVQASWPKLSNVCPVSQRGLHGKNS